MREELWNAADLLTLRMTPGVGAVTIRRLCALSASREIPLWEWFSRPAREVAEYLPENAPNLLAALAACTPEAQKRAAELLRNTEGCGVRLLLFDAPEYPAGLYAGLGMAAPALLFVRGSAALLRGPAAGIVGARKATPEGLRLAGECARVFAGMGLPVVSGGARGVDSAAHDSALSAGGKTVFVLPQGLFTYQMAPAYRGALDEERAVFITDCLPNAPWQTAAAVARNGVISALAHLLCVIEPRSLGGSLKTARHSLEQGKPVRYAGLHGPAETLAEARGAAPLPARGGMLDAARLRAAWNTPVRGTPQQESLL